MEKKKVVFKEDVKVEEKNRLGGITWNLEKLKEEIRLELKKERNRQTE